MLGGILTQFAVVALDLAHQRPHRPGCRVSARPAWCAKAGGHQSARAYDVPGAVSVTGGLFCWCSDLPRPKPTAGGRPSRLACSPVPSWRWSPSSLSSCALHIRCCRSRVILDRNRGGAYLASLLVGSAMLGTFLFLTYFFQATLRYSALKTGFAFLPFSIGIIAGATLASRLLPNIGPRVLMVIGLTLGPRSPLVHPTRRRQQLPRPRVTSRNRREPRNGNDVRADEQHGAHRGDPRDAGVASALVNTTQQVGGSLGIALLNTVAATAAAGYLAGHLGSADGDPNCGRSRLHHGFHRKRSSAGICRHRGRCAHQGHPARSVDQYRAGAGCRRRRRGTLLVCRRSSSLLAWLSAQHVQLVLHVGRGRPPTRHSVPCRGAPA